MMRGILLAAAATCILAASAADAAIVTRTSTGTISSGTDMFGLFGDIGADLTDASFTTITTWDTSIGHLYVYGPPDASEYLHGEAGYGYPGVAVVTINGHSLTFANNVDGLLVANSNGGSTNDIYEDGVEGGLPYQISWFDSFDLIPSYQPSSLFEPFSVDCTTGDVCSGEFFKTLGAGNMDLALNFTSISISSSAPAPEPTIWLMMIVGFGLAGFDLRRRRALA